MRGDKLFTDGGGALTRISVACALPPQVDVRTVKNLKMSPKGRTDLKIWPSKAKNLEELEFDVRKSLAPRKSIENYEKPKKKSEENFRRQKIEICKSSETRVAKVSQRFAAKFEG